MLLRAPHGETTDRPLTYPPRRLAAVNFFLGLVGIVQCSRIFLYKQSQKDKTAVPASVDEAKQEIKEVVKS